MQWNEHHFHTLDPSSVSQDELSCRRKDQTPDQIGLYPRSTGKRARGSLEPRNKDTMSEVSGRSYLNSAVTAVIIIIIIIVVLFYLQCLVPMALCFWTKKIVNETFKMH